MRPESIEEERRQRKRSAITGVVFFVLLQLATAICFGALCFIPEIPKWAAVLFAVMAAVCLGTIVPALLALRERFREIEGGELDEAGQY